MKTPFFNIFINNNIETDRLKFQCTFDSAILSHNLHRDIDIPTHIVSVKKGYTLGKSILFDGKKDNELKDISLLLTISQGTQIFAKGQNLGRVSSYRKEDTELFLSYEIGDFIQIALENLAKMQDQERVIIKQAMLMFYQAKHYLFYDDLRDILMMNCFEFLLGAIYRLDPSNTNKDVYISDSFSYIMQKFNYQGCIDIKLRAEIGTQKLSEFKKAKNIKLIKSFSAQFVSMRNYIAHGKHSQKPIFADNFHFKLEAFIRIILIDLLYNKDYKRKFDILYQCILEQQIPLILTPEFPVLRLRYKETKKPQ